MKAELVGKVALVTGASYGLGRAIAEELGGRGARVMLTDIDGRLPETATALTAAGLSVAHARLDVTQRESVHDAVAQAVSTFGQLDIFVNNAGYSKTLN